MFSWVTVDSILLCGFLEGCTPSPFQTYLYLEYYLYQYQNKNKAVNKLKFKAALHFIHQNNGSVSLGQISYLGWSIHIASI